jgi:hypothetical protein
MREWRVSVGAMTNADHGQIFARVTFGEADFRSNDISDECLKTGVGQVTANELEARDDVGDDGFIHPYFASYMCRVDLGHWQNPVLDEPRMGWETPANL